MKGCLLMRNPKNVCSRIGLALLAMMAVWLILGSVLTGVVMLIPAAQGIGWMAIMLNDLTLYALGVPLFLLIMHFIPDGREGRPAPAPFGPGKFLLVLVAAFGVMYVGNLVSVALYAATESMSGAEQLDVLGSIVLSSGMLSNFIFLVVVPAIGEEFIFRYMIRKKMRGAGDWNYILFSSLCFALFHMNLQQVLYAFLLGLVFSWLYVRTGKIWLPMLLHFVINATGTVLMPFLLDKVPEWTLYVVMGAFIAGGAVVLAVKLAGAWRALLPPTEPGWPGKRRAVPGMPPVPYRAGQPIDAQAGGGPTMQLPYGPHDPLPQMPNRSVMPGQYGGPPEMGNLPAAPQPGGGMAPVRPPRGVLFGNVGMVLYIVFTGLMTLFVFLMPLLLQYVTDVLNISI